MTVFCAQYLCVSSHLAGGSHFLDPTAGKPNGGVNRANKQSLSPLHIACQLADLVRGQTLVVGCGSSGMSVWCERTDLVMGSSGMSVSCERTDPCDGVIRSVCMV